MQNRNFITFWYFGDKFISFIIIIIIIIIFKLQIIKVNCYIHIYIAV